MPEIGEVARVVHYLRKYLVNRTIKSVQAFEDDIVYGKVGCSAATFQKAVQGKKVTGVGQQGKYFYVTFDSPPHSVMHLGMTGWVQFSAEETYYYKQAKENKGSQEWPPKYMKFLLKCDAEKVEGEEKEPVEVAFVDPRRLARIRLVNCEASAIRQESPLKENGPDPVIDTDILTVDFLSQMMRKKRVPIKALLLDQANISGVGNWVADEVLFGARLHPEQYSNTFSDAQIKQLHGSLIEVCTTACELLADSSRFPEHWLMKYRWDKGKKDANVLPSGEKIVHLKVGGRTSAVVPSLQKKTAAVAGDISPAELNDQTEEASKASPRKRKANQEEEEEQEKEEAPAITDVALAGVEKAKPTKRGRTSVVKANQNPPKSGTAKTGRNSDKAETDALETKSENRVSSKDKTGLLNRSKARSISKKSEELITSASRSSPRTRSKTNI